MTWEFSKLWKYIFRFCYFRKNIFYYELISTDYSEVDHTYCYNTYYLITKIDTSKVTRQIQADLYFPLV